MANFIPRLEWNPVQLTCEIVEDDNVLYNVSDTSDIVIGQSVHGTGIPFPAVVTGKTSSTITLDQDATQGEPERTNYFTYSQQFDNAAWTPTRSSISANDINGPAGALTADKLVEDSTASNTHFVGRSMSVISGTTYAFSVYAKADERDRIRMAAGNTGTLPLSATFNLLTGTIITELFGTAAIEDVGGGWYRCSVTATAAVTSATSINVFIVNGGSSSYSGDGVSGLHIDSSQFEIVGATGENVTSYILTTTAAATRAASTSVIDFLTLFDFNYPSIKQARAEFLPTEQISESVGGIRQVQINNIIKKVNLEFKFLPLASLTELEEDFFLAWAVYGKSFRYYESFDEDSYEEYEMDSLDFKPIREIPKAGDFLYKIALKFRRVYL